jgi:hypothetical protein
MRRHKIIRDMAIGCADNSCIFGSPGGMGTNGGCRCDQSVLRRDIQVLLKELEKCSEKEAVPYVAEHI